MPDARPAQHVIHRNRPQHPADGNHYDGDKVQPGAHHGLGFQKNAHRKSDAAAQGHRRTPGQAKAGLPALDYGLEHVDERSNAGKRHGKEEKDCKKAAKRHLLEYGGQGNEHQGGAAGHIDAEGEDRGHNGKAGQKGCHCVEQGRAQRGRGDIGAFIQIGAVYDHAGAGDGKREKGLAHCHDPGVEPEQSLPPGHEQKTIALGGAGQKGDPHRQKEKQCKEQRHQDLAGLFDAFCYTQGENQAHHRHNGGVPGQAAKSPGGP